MRKGLLLYRSPFEATFQKGVLDVDTCFAYKCSGLSEIDLGDLKADIAEEARLISPKGKHYRTRCFSNPCQDSLMNLHASPHMENTQYNWNLRTAQNLSQYLRSYDVEAKKFLHTAPHLYRTMAYSVELLREDERRWKDPAKLDYRLACTGENLDFWGLSDTYLAAALNWICLTYEFFEKYLHPLTGTTWRKGYIGLRLARGSLLHSPDFSSKAFGVPSERGRGMLHAPFNLQQFLKDSESIELWRRPPAEPQQSEPQ